MKIEQKEILDYIKQGYSQQEIADKKGVTQQTISKWMKQIDTKKIQEAKQYAKENTTHKDRKDRRTKSTLIRKMKLKKLTIEDVKKFRELIDERYTEGTFEDIALLVKAYIRTGKIQEAIWFLEGIIYNEDMKHLEIEELEKLRRELKEIQTIQTKRREVRRGKQESNIK